MALADEVRQMWGKQTVTIMAIIVGDIQVLKTKSCQLGTDGKALHTYAKTCNFGHVQYGSKGSRRVVKVF